MTLDNPAGSRIKPGTRDRLEMHRKAPTCHGMLGCSAYRPTRSPPWVTHWSEYNTCSRDSQSVKQRKGGRSSHEVPLREHCPVQYGVQGGPDPLLQVYLDRLESSSPCATRHKIDIEELSLDQPRCTRAEEATFPRSLDELLHVVL